MLERRWYSWLILWAGSCAWMFVVTAYFYGAALFVTEGLTTEKVFISIAYSLGLCTIYTLLLGCQYKFGVPLRDADSLTLASFIGMSICLVVIALSTIVLFFYAMFWVCWHVLGLSMFFSIYVAVVLPIPIAAMIYLARTTRPIPFVDTLPSTIMV